MTIGPEPRTRTLSIEGVAGSAHASGCPTPRRTEVEESVEEVLVIQRSWGRLGMKLDGQDRQIAVCEPLDGAVIEIDQTHFPPGVGGHACRIDLEPVILGRDRDAPGSHVPHRVVPASMPELQFSRLGADRPRQELMTQTDAEVGNLRSSRRQRRRRGRRRGSRDRQDRAIPPPRPVGAARSRQATCRTERRSPELPA